MRILKIILLIVLILAILLGLALFIFFKTFDVNKFRPKLTEELSSVLGREVSIGHISHKISPTKGLVLTVNDVVLKDGPESSSGDFVRIKKIFLALDTNAFLKQKKILVSQVEVHSPKINIVKNKEGILNVPSSEESESAEQMPVPLQLDSKSQQIFSGSSKQLKSVPLLVKSIKIIDGELDYYDKTKNPPQHLEITKINFGLEDFSLASSFKFWFSCSVFGTQKNVDIKGNAIIDANKGQLRLDSVAINVDMSKVSLKSLQDFLPQVEAVKLKVPLEGHVNSFADQIIIGPQGLVYTDLVGGLQGGKIWLENFEVPLSNISLNHEISKDAVKVSKIFLNLGAGQITGQGHVEDYLNSQNYVLDISVKDISVEQVIPKFDDEIKFQGDLFSEIKVNGQGFSPEDISSSLNGDIYISIKNGRLVNLNVLRLILSKISIIPDLAEKVEANLPEKYKEKLKDKDTIFASIEFDLKGQGENIFINKAELVADTFTLSAQGTVDWKQNLEIESVIFIPADLSASMVASVEQLNALVDENGRINIPLRRYSGKAASFRPLPDLGYLGKRLIINEGKEQLYRLLDKVFGNEDDEQQDTEQQPGEPSREKPVRPEREIIENILDSIFK